jgi:GAF domain-containing protein/two-component sensor histidine kinase
VLKAMSASPGDPQPVFDLIVERARDLCDAYGVTVLELDGGLLHYRAANGVSDDAETREAFAAMYPRPPTRDMPQGRAILDRRTIRIDDLEADQGLNPFYRGITSKSTVVVPLMRGEVAIGTVGIGSRERGGFSDIQIALLQTFAEQAVIAITSAETYRALQTRTADLQETLEYQTAISDVLKVISRSAFDLQPILDTVVETAARLCSAEMAGIARREGDLFRLAGQRGFPAEITREMWRAFDFGNTVSGRAAREGRIIRVRNVADEPNYPEELIRIGKQRSSLGVPLLRGDEVIGVMALARQRVEPFTDRQIELVSTFADQAVIAIENTRLLTEQREALEQQTATAEVLQVINASPGDLAPVFDALLEKALRFCGAAFGNLATYDGAYFHPVAMRGVAPGYAASLNRPLPPFPAGTGRLVAGESVVQIADIAATDDYRLGVEHVRASADQGGMRTALFVALRKADTLLGRITIFRQEVRPFSDKQIALLENFAAQAVVAMENARLINEQREALEQQTATAEVLQVINASPGDLTPVFDAMLEKAMRLCGVAFGMMTTFDGERFHPIVWRGLPAALSAYFAEGGGPSASSGMHGRLVAGSALAHVVGMKDEEAYRSGYAARRALVDLGGAQTGLAIALRKDDALLGTFMLYRQEVRPFTDKQIALLQNFAAQAVIAMENARLITEQREALEQQTATAEVLQVINANPGNLAPVFDVILEKAMRLCRAAFGSLYTYDGDRFLSAAQRGVPPAYAEFRAHHPPTLAKGGGVAALVETRKPVHILDTAAHELYRAGQPGIRAMVELGGVRTSLIVPLLKDDVLLGFMSVYRQEMRPFSDKQIALVENFAAQAVIAMENARLLTEQREALEQQTATAEVLQVINASPGNLAPVFDTMLENAIRLCGAALGSLYTYDGENFHPVALRGVSPAFTELITKHPPTVRPGNPLARVLETKRPVHVPDVKDEEMYRSGTAPARALVDVAGVRALVNIPLVQDDKVLGLFAIYRKVAGRFSDKQIKLLENFAAQAVIAMENARLLGEIRQRQDELRITFENMGDGVAMFDETLSLVAWNRNFQELLDIPDTALAERPSYANYLRLLAERGEFGTEDVEAELARRLGDTDRELRLERVRPDGRIIEVRRNAVPGGGFVLIYSDITERKRSEEDIRAARDAAETALRELKTAQANLIQAEKMASLGQLTAGIAHEIKNPLNFVNNFAALSVDLLSELKETAAPGFAALTDDQRAEIEDVSAMLTSNLEKINEHGKRADGIVKAMLEHSRGSSGERRMVDLNALIDEALNLAYHGARAQDQSFNITLERDFSSGIAPIEVNPQDMTRVFLNIFANGFYAVTRPARSDGDAGFVPTLKVITRGTGDAVEIRVRDNGTGIPADIKDKLFQPFFTTKPTGEGTGLGLSITYDIVTQQHGGEIAVDSKVGDYSEFTIRLPRKP